MIPLQIPHVWAAMLNLVQGELPSAVIAGGALRDLWHDKPIKDVDIFIPVKADEVDLDVIEKKVLSIYPYAELVLTSMYGQKGDQAAPGFRNIFAIWRMTVDGVIYELIFIEDMGERMIDVFDISICQISFDGKELFVTDEFYRSVKDGVIRVCNTNRADRQVKRLKRVMDKYPEYVCEPGALDESDDIPF
jgi:hypothetical protein